MADVIPFKGIIYNPQKVDLSSVTAPPYDIVTPEFKNILYKRSPYNIIRIDFGKDSASDNEKKNRYTRASESFSQWLEDKILTEDAEPSFYCYEISYKINGKEKKLSGFLGAVRLEKLGSGKIHPHEMTYSKPKADRLNILRFCRANISPIFSLYSSGKRRSSSILKKTVKQKALAEAKNGDGFIHKLWRINDRNSIAIIKKELSNKDIFIADGHHRYETALEFRDEMNKIRGQGSGVRGRESEPNPWDYVMMFLVNMEDDGLAILPTHRLTSTEKKTKDLNHNLKKLLEPHFDITAISFNRSSEKKAAQKMFSAMKKGRNTLGMLVKDEKTFYVLKFRGTHAKIKTHKSLKKLDVTILHKLIFEKLLGVDKFEYEMNPELVIKKLKNGPFHTAFFLNPTKAQDVRKVALAGQRMPPKSTYFYPKLLTGMVIYKF
jgi:uncharacterized protein (DUF1015 family)